MIADDPTEARMPRPSLRRRVLVVALANLIVFLILMIACELGARAVVWARGIPTEFRSRTFQGFGMTDPTLWWKLRPNLDTWMRSVRLKTNRHGFRDARQEPSPRAVKVYCLGDSSTFGWQVNAPQMYTAVAEEALDEAIPSGVDLISTGVPGYTSYQCLQQFREQVAERKPDWVVVMIGNNECRSRSTGDRDRGAALARKRALERWLGWSALWILMTRAPEDLTRDWELTPAPGRVANTPDEYRQNVRDLIREARAVGCRVLVMGMPLRLRLEPDWPHHDRPTAEVTDLLARADEASRPLDERAALVESAIRIQPDQFAAHWRLAEIEMARGHLAEADRQFALAREGDLHPDAAKPGYNRVLEALCREKDVPFLDLDRLFRDSGRPEEDLFLDHCHPSPAGLRLIGRELARRLAESLAPSMPTS